ncbi:MAG: GHKL domain-containing protein [Oscillospiraceae bacterium]
MKIEFLYQILVFLLLSLGETFILHRLLIAFLSPNGAFKQHYKKGLGAYFIFQILSYILRAPLFSTAGLYFVFTMAISYIFFADNLQMKATVCAIFVILNYACKVLSATLIMYAFKRTMPNLPTDMVLGAPEQITACLLFYFSILMIIELRKLRIQKHNTAYTIIAYIMPIGIMFIVINMFYHINNKSVAHIYLDASGLLFCSALALFYLLDKSVVIDQTQEQNLIGMQLLATQEKYYEHLSSFQKEMQSIRHDIKNHTLCAISMLEIGQFAQAEEYLRELYNRTAKMKSPLHCGNNVIDIVLNHSITNMDAMNIEHNINVIVPPSLDPIDKLDLCVLFGNLLDNSIEACGRISAPEAKKIYKHKRRREKKLSDYKYIKHF